MASSNILTNTGNTNSGPANNTNGNSASSSSGTGSVSGSLSSNASSSSDRVLANILESFPTWDLNGGFMPNVGQFNNSPPQSDFFINNFLGALDTQGDFGMGAIGSGPRNPKLSPESSSSSISCSWCEVNASTRCLDCNEYMCTDCLRNHRNMPASSNHAIVTLPTPIGSSPTGGISSNSHSPPSSIYICDIHNEMLRYVCDFCRKLVCQFCILHDHKEHSSTSIQNFIFYSKERLAKTMESSQVGTRCIRTSIDKALAFIRLIERNCGELSDNIRKAFRQFIIAIEDRERFLLEFVDKLRQRRLAMLHDQMAGLKSALSGIAETADMLNKLGENASQMDQIELAMKLTSGQRQMEQFSDVYKDLQPRQELFAFVPPDYGLLQDIRNQGSIIVVDDKNEAVGNANGLVAPPPIAPPAVINGANGGLNGVNGGLNMANGGLNIANGGLNIGNAGLNGPNAGLNGANGGLNGANGAINAANGAMNGAVGGVGAGAGNFDMVFGPVLALANVGNPMPVAPNNVRRPLLRDNSFRIPSPVLQPPPPRVGSGLGLPNAALEWELNGVPAAPGAHFNAARTTQSIPGCAEIVKARNSNCLTLSFATEGHEDGQVSRPWGLCVDKMGHILVSDRRNNRVQIFNPDGSLKFKFGRKGVNSGEFDLPAGICVDMDNRIIVVDKDNHRVQIFTNSGVFLLKFGSYGKEYGQFQYPWDVAVNSRRQIVVTDSRNHRIQQFDSEGRFIRQIVFENNPNSKAVPSPRGITYTPTGNIIVSDFDNHCLYLIDPDNNEILSVKGHEGTGFHEFNRPSGICCDDDGRIILADSKNQRILVFSQNLDFLWDIDTRPATNPLMPATLDEKDRTCDVALMPDGRIVFLIELSPDSKEGSNPYKRFVHIF